MITIENWSFSCYKSAKFRVNISLGATTSDSSEAAKYIYFINKFNGEALIHQQETYDLEQAISQINSTYKYWEFVDLEKKLHGSGCSTCQAHD